MKNVVHGNMNQGVFLIIWDFFSVGSQVYLGIKYDDFDSLMPRFFDGGI